MMSLFCSSATFTRNHGDGPQPWTDGQMVHGKLTSLLHMMLSVCSAEFYSCDVNVDVSILYFQKILELKTEGWTLK